VDILSESHVFFILFTMFTLYNILEKKAMFKELVVYSSVDFLIEHHGFLFCKHGFTIVYFTREFSCLLSIKSVKKF
jgi:hypothetical protein